VGIKHVFVSTVADGSTVEHVRPSDWNADHTIDGAVILSSGTATNTPLKFVAGALNTNATAGAMEFDGTCFYNTAITNTRQVSVAQQVITQTTTRTLTTSTDAQYLFNATTAGAVTVGKGTYFFECQHAITGMSTSGAKGIGFGLAGSATFTQKWWLFVANSSALNNPANSVQGYFSAYSTAILTSTLQTCKFKAQGRIVVTASGTVIPTAQITAQNSTASVLANNSYFSIYPIGSSVVAFVGNWS
jgi:hypothetical protein